MKKNINLDDFENIMLGKNLKSKTSSKNNKEKTISKKNIIRTTFEDADNIDMNKLLGIENNSKKRIDTKTKQHIIRTTIEEPKIIYNKKSFKENKNITLEEFTKIMLGIDICSVTTKTKQNQTKKETTIIENTIPVIKTIIIDGSNVLRKMYKMKEEKELNYETETRLIVLFYEFLKQYIIGSYQKISLYLDGKKRKIDTEMHPHIQLEFSKRKKADDLIVNDLYQTIQQQPNIKKEVKLITEDRDLINRCKNIWPNIEIISSNKLLELFGHSKDFVLNTNNK